MVTGAYWPEISGGGLQCRTMIHALGRDLRFRVLTTCTDPSLPADDRVDDIPVTRLFVEVARPASKLRAALATIQFFLRHHASFRIVHLHGFSQKSVLIALLARLFGKTMVITIHTAEHDEPSGVRRQGRLAYWCYSTAHRFIAVSDSLARNYQAAGLPADRLRVIPNSVDTARFRPPSAAERDAIRKTIGSLPPDVPWILFVGFFSADKRPDALFEAWLRLGESTGRPSALLFVGATDSAYHEVDSQLARRIRDQASRRGVAHLIHFAGEVRDVERYYRAADMFVMPSVREAFGMALVEAMASGLPVIATRMAGVTDTIVADGVTGVLVDGGDVGGLTGAMSRLLADRTGAGRMATEARQSVTARYGVETKRNQWLEVYGEVAG